MRKPSAWLGRQHPRPVAAEALASQGSAADRATGGRNACPDAEKERSCAAMRSGSSRRSRDPDADAFDELISNDEALAKAIVRDVVALHHGQNTPEPASRLQPPAAPPAAL